MYFRFREGRPCKFDSGKRVLVLQAGKITSASGVVRYKACVQHVGDEAMGCGGQLTSILMMGALSPGLKRHSVTLFEGTLFQWSNPQRLMSQWLYLDRSPVP